MKFTVIPAPYNLIKLQVKACNAFIILGSSYNICDSGLEILKALQQLCRFAHWSFGIKNILCRVGIAIQGLS